MKLFLIISLLISLINIRYSQTDQTKLFNFNEFYLNTLYEAFYFNITSIANFSIDCQESLGSLLESFENNPEWSEKGDNLIFKQNFYLNKLIVSS